jgi:hypothetical protein
MSETGTRLAVTVALLAAGAVVAALLASTGGAQQPGERTFKLIGSEPVSQAFGDVAPRSKNRRNPRFSSGDLYLITRKLFDESNAPVGKLYQHCIAVRGGRTFRRSTFQCIGTWRLRDGAITTAVGFRATERDEDVPLAITGGTGAYQGARGQISTRFVGQGEQARAEHTVHLLP